MGDRDPSQHLGKLPILSRPEEEMSVIRHQAIGGNPYPCLGMGLGQNLLKGDVVRRLLKQRESPDAAVQDMIVEGSSSEARAAWHADLLPDRRDLVKKRLPTPFIPLGTTFFSP
jgi:hypothetical protein